MASPTQAEADDGDSEDLSWPAQGPAPSTPGSLQLLAGLRMAMQM